MRKVSTVTHFTHTVKMKPLLAGYGNRPSFCWRLASLHLVLIRLGKLACLWTNKSFQSKICKWQNRVWQILQLIHSYSPFITYVRAYLLSVHNFLQTRNSLFRGLWVFMPTFLGEYTERCKEMTISVLLYCRSKQLFHKKSTQKRSLW